MEGVTILSTATVTLGISWGVAIPMALVVSILIFVLISILAVEEPIEYFYAAITAVLVTILGFIPVWAISMDSTEVIEYKVTIDDSVKYNEFIEKYEVIDQEGEIYTVRERIKE